jgi:hypothetical protein
MADFAAARPGSPAVRDRTIFRQNQAITVKLIKTLIASGFYRPNPGSMPVEAKRLPVNEQVHVFLLPGASYRK